MLPRPPSHQLHRALCQQLLHGAVADDKQVAPVELGHIAAGVRGDRGWGWADRDGPAVRQRGRRAGRAHTAAGHWSPHGELSAARQPSAAAAAPAAPAHPSSSTVTLPRSSSTRQNTCLSGSGAGTMSLCGCAAAWRTSELNASAAGQRVRQGWVEGKRQGPWRQSCKLQAGSPLRCSRSAAGAKHSKLPRPCLADAPGRWFAAAAFMCEPKSTK